MNTVYTVKATIVNRHTAQNAVRVLRIPMSTNTRNLSISFAPTGANMSPVHGCGRDSVTFPH